VGLWCGFPGLVWRAILAELCGVPTVGGRASNLAPAEGQGRRLVREGRSDGTMCNRSQLWVRWDGNFKLFPAGR